MNSKDEEIYVIKIKSDILKKISQKELDERIKNIRNELENLISIEGATIMVGAELGVLPKPEMQQEIREFSTVDLLELPRDKYITGKLISLIVDKTPIRTITARTGLEYSVSNLVLASAFPIVIVLWGNQAEDLIANTGDIVVLEDFKITEYRGTMQLNQSKFGSLKIIRRKQQSLVIGEDKLPLSLRDRILNVISDTKLKTGISLLSLFDEFEDVAQEDIQSEIVSLINEGKIYSPKPERYKIL